MKKLKKIKFEYFLAVIVALLIAHGVQTKKTSKMANSQKISYAKQGQAKWTGPGFYYGFWFGSVDSYNQWWKEDYQSSHNVKSKNSKKQASSLSSRKAFRSN